MKRKKSEIYSRIDMMWNSQATKLSIIISAHQTAQKTLYMNDERGDYI